ncbi:S1/P1 nuclease [Fulvimonas soli]|uniref:S1/P1 nuclease n=1 Tax=Fulvimonas soli TaxID=155197 RepID=A0A316HWB8_9GAMM|nr:S1/P1 nuclease [Fulvimonas soli]PWK85746.1 S1/P1 nuclease [Fulvimonas soli]TNY25693.1 S1/P1 Nuclease [Fulvimonas soli]
MLPLRRLLTAVLAGLALAPAAQAWGPLGHSIVAELAQRHLSPAAEAEVERLLAPEHTTRLADVASWPDQIQDDPALAALWKQTRALHYIDFVHGDCDYVPPRDCKGDKCVVAGIEHYVRILADRGQPDAARREALKFVVHFVGDVHQPLHAGSRDDKGGNTYQVQFQGKGSNLHRVWDSGLLSTRGLDWRAYAAELDARGPVPLPPPIAPLDDPYAQWAEESCRITAAPGFYPDGHVIGQAYVDAELPTAELRLREAGRRLAEVLNLALAR